MTMEGGAAGTFETRAMRFFLSMGPSASLAEDPLRFFWRAPPRLGAASGWEGAAASMVDEFRRVRSEEMRVVVSS